jgi:hypothetical protein
MYDYMYTDYREVYFVETHSNAPVEVAPEMWCLCDSLRSFVSIGDASE